MCCRSYTVKHQYNRHCGNQILSIIFMSVISKMYNYFLVSLYIDVSIFVTIKVCLLLSKPRFNEKNLEARSFI